MQTDFTKLARRIVRLCAAFALAASACVALPVGTICEPEQLFAAAAAVHCALPAPPVSKPA